MIGILGDAIVASIDATVAVIVEDHQEHIAIIGRVGGYGGVRVGHKPVCDFIALVELNSLHGVFTRVRIKRSAGICPYIIQSS